MKKLLSVLLCVVMLVSVCGVAAFAEEKEIAISRVSVCVNGNTATSRGFCWYTNAKTGTKIQVLCDREDITSTLNITKCICEEWEKMYMHKITIDNFDAGKTYTYRVGDGNVWSDYGTFTTDNCDNKVEFVAVADVQAGNLNSFLKASNVLEEAFKMMPNADFYANLGDFTNDSDNEEWNFYAQAFDAINLSHTMAPVSGNHDGYSVWHWFENMFNVDTSESVLNLNGVNYSYDYGNAHFAVMNTNDMGAASTAQLKWLKNDLNSTDKDWKIVFLHKSPYTLGKDGKWPDALSLQDYLTDVMDECNVDLAMFGHDHMYLRTKPLTNNKVDENGTTYVLAGTAGSKRYEVRSFLIDTFMPTSLIATSVTQKYGNYYNGKDWSSVSEDNIGGVFNTVTIEDGVLTLKAYVVSDKKLPSGANNVKLIDEVTFKKATGENKITFAGDNNTTTFEYILNVIPTCINLVKYTLIKWLPKAIKALPELARDYIKEGIF